MKNKGMILLNIAVILFGLAGLFAKWIILPSLVITFGRVFFSSIVLNGYRMIKKEKDQIEKKHFYLVVVLGIILAYHWYSFLQSIQLSTVAIGTVSYSAFPLFVIMIEMFLMKQKQSKYEILEALMVIIGVVILSQGSFQSRYITGLLIGLSSALSYALLTIGNSYLSKHYSSSTITCYEQTTAMLVLFPIVLFTFNFQMRLTDLILLMILGIFMTAIAHSIFVSSLKDVKTSVAGIVSSLESPYSILFALLFIHEIPSVYEIIGCMIIVSAALIIQFKNIKIVQE